MFEDSLLESSGRLKPNRGWATLASILVHCFVAGALVLIPLLFPDTPPETQFVTFLVAPPPPPPPPLPGPGKTGKTSHPITNIVEAPGKLHAPASVAGVALASSASGRGSSPGSPDYDGVAGGVPGGVPGGVVGGVVGGVPGGVVGGVLGGTLGGVMGGLISSIPNTAVVPRISLPAERSRPLRVSEGVSKGMLISKVIPEYPMLAREARISGVVVLSATIDKNGEIKNLQVISGHPLLVPAAMAAVEHWLYKPYLLNHEPVEVQTQVTVTFALAGKGE